MHKPVLLILLATGILSGHCSDCGGTESKQGSRATSSSERLSSELASLRYLAGIEFRTAFSEHFAIVHEVGADDISGTARALESAYRRFYETFSETGFELSRSQDRLTWICFPQQGGFNRYALRAEGMDLSWLDGYYSTLTNRVAVVQPNLRLHEREEPPAAPGTGDARITLAAGKQQSERVLPMTPAGYRLDVVRLTHELAHQLAFNSGLQKRGVMYPVWVSEGLATNFESCGADDASITPSNAARSDCLAATYAAGEVVPLREFVVQTRVCADARTSRQHYAQAWAFFRFIVSERPESLRKYLKYVGSLTEGLRDPHLLLEEFTAAFGTPESLESAWNAFLIRQMNSPRQAFRP